MAGAQGVQNGAGGGIGGSGSIGGGSGGGGGLYMKDGWTIGVMSLVKVHRIQLYRWMDG